MNARMLALTLALCVSAFAQKGQYAVPEGAGVKEFPIVSGPLTVAQAATMNLTPEKLTKPTVVENHFRDLRSKEGRWVLETLPVGTLVYRDALGRLEYKADCGNRIVEVDNPPAVVSTINYPPAVPTAKSGTTGAGPTIWQKMTDVLKSFAEGLWALIGSTLAPLGWFLLLLLGIALIMAVVIAASVALANLYSRWYNSGYTSPVQRRSTQPASTDAPEAQTDKVQPSVVSQPDPRINQSGEFVRATDAPAAASAGKRSFFSFAHGDAKNPHMLRWQGMDIHQFERGADGVHTLRFTHHQ